VAKEPDGEKARGRKSQGRISQGAKRQKDEKATFVKMLFL